MNRYFLIILGIFAAIIFYTTVIERGEEIEKEAKEAALEKQKEAVNREIKSRIENAASTYHAKSGWERELVDSTGFRHGSIFSIELEDLWVVDKPLLFYGYIMDISSLNDDEILLELDIDTFNQKDVYLSSDLHLNLKASKNTIRDFLKAHSEIKNAFDGDRYVAVIAKINSVGLKKSYYAERDYEDVYLEEVDIKTGNGTIIEMIYIGDSFTFHFN